MDQIKGVVESTWDDGNKVKIDGIWFSNKFKDLPDGCEKGSTIELEYDNNPKYKNQFWKKINVTAAGSKPVTSNKGGGGGGFGGRSNFPIPYTDHSTAIIRQNALTNAVNFLTGSSPKKAHSPDEVLLVAAQFANWTSGRMDAEAAEAMDQEFVPE